MTERNARRVVLALMSRPCFDCVSETARHVSRGEPVLEDFGFSALEVERAVRDRVVIARAYESLKRSRSYWTSEIEARMRFLSDLDDGGGT